VSLNEASRAQRCLVPGHLCSLILSYLGFFYRWFLSFAHRGKLSFHSKTTPLPGTNFESPKPNHSFGSFSKGSPDQSFRGMSISSESRTVVNKPFLPLSFKIFRYAPLGRDLSEIWYAPQTKKTNTFDLERKTFPLSTRVAEITKKFAIFYSTQEK